jgi:ParB-like chromosome segregation protein Spo0J
MMELSVTENVLRKDLNPIEEAEAYQHLVALGNILRQISKKVGKSAGHISMLLALLKQKDVTDAVRQERIGIREAHQIAKVEDKAVRSELLARTARGELDREAVKQAVQIVQEQAAAPPPAPAPPTQKVQPQTQPEPPAAVVPPTTEADTGNVRVCQTAMIPCQICGRP